MKVVIVHDWLVGGGAERVVLELHRMFPDAPIYTSYCTDEWQEKLDGKVITGYLQKWPFSTLRKFLPLLRQAWFKNLDLTEFDLVISSSGNGEAKFARIGEQKRRWLSKGSAVRGANENRKGDVHDSTVTAARSSQQSNAGQSASGVVSSADEQDGAVRKPVHVCYCHTPPHFYWAKYNEYMKEPGFKPKWLVRLGLKLFINPLRKRDYAAAQRVDIFIANSSHIQKNIKTFYGKDSVVVHPPVNTDRFAMTGERQRKGFITVGRQVPYKRTEIIIQACNELGLSLKVIGRGPEHGKLQDIAGPTVELLVNVTDDALPEHLAAAEAFLFAAEEDFGVAPVEAMATGTPVIAFKSGGALDYVKEGQTGLFFDEQSAESLQAALTKFSKLQFHAEEVAASAAEYSPDAFQKHVSEVIARSGLVLE